MIKRCPTFLIPFAMLAVFANPAHADHHHLDRLRDAVSRGEVMPLSTLQNQVRRAFPGEIIDVELDEDDGRFIYEFKVLKADGRLIEIEMDARDGKVLDIDDDE